MPHSYPGLVVSGQVVSAAHINGIRNAAVAAYSEIYAPTANVAMGGFSITGALNITATGMVSAATVAASGALTGATVTATGAIQGSRFISTGATYGTPAFSIPNGGGYALLGDAGVFQSWPSNGIGGTFFGHNSAHHGGTGWKAQITGAAAGLLIDTGAVRFFTATSVSGGSVQTLVERACVNSIGFGVGTSSPSALHHVRAGTNKNFLVHDAVSVTGAVSLSAANDANSVNTPLEVRASLVALPFGRLRLSSLPTYANNAAALAALSAGDLYQVTGSDPRQVAIVF